MLNAKLVFTGFSVSLLALSINISSASSQSVVNHGGTGGTILNTQKNPATTKAPCSTAVTASDFAPVSQIGTNPPTEVIDPASSSGATSCAEGGKSQIGDTTSSSTLYNGDGSFSPAATSAAKSFADSNSKASVGDLANNLKVDLATAQKLNNDLNLGLNQSNSQVTTGNGSGNPVSTSVDTRDQSVSTTSIKNEVPIIPATVLPSNPVAGTSGQLVDFALACPQGSVKLQQHVYAANVSEDTRGGIGLSFLSLQGGRGTSSNGKLPADVVPGTTVVGLLNGISNGTILSQCSFPPAPPVVPPTFVPPAPPVVPPTVPPTVKWEN